jgi:hypothetical protein
MNQDLVDRLAAEAWRYANNYTGDDVMPQIKRFHRRLAELVVIECARFDSEYLNEDHVEGETYNWPLLDHFGVKP